jgi:hypothetical protein
MKSFSIYTGIRCGEHTFQLAINDAIKHHAKKKGDTIDECREFVKKMRTPTYSFILEQHNIKRPLIDIETR